MKHCVTKMRLCSNNRAMLINLSRNKMHRCTMNKIHLAKICNTQDEAYRVQDVRLSAPVKSRNRVELLIETVYFDSFTVRFESLQYYRFDIHVK